MRLVIILISVLWGMCSYGQTYKIEPLGKNSYWRSGKQLKVKITKDGEVLRDYVLSVDPVGKSKGNIKIINNGKPVCLVTLPYAKSVMLSISIDEKSVYSMEEKLWYTPNPTLLFSSDTMSKKQLIKELRTLKIGDPNDYAETLYKLKSMIVSISSGGQVYEYKVTDPKSPKMISLLKDKAKVRVNFISVKAERLGDAPKEIVIEPAIIYLKS
ncbi:MAG: hypothetical protein JKY54_10360 [Flavobacteriales bacterium]|nr:hypothetical protein [Flavobacteriales bacterium]